MASQRPWWKKKCWAVLGLLWLAVAYPASIGPAHYCQERGWLSYVMLSSYKQPASAVFPNDGKYARYVRWWSDLGYYHHTGEKPITIYVRITR